MRSRFRMRYLFPALFQASQNGERNKRKVYDLEVNHRRNAKCIMKKK